MSAERDVSLDEKRVYDAKRGKTDVFVATGAGLARVEVSGERVGGFGLARRGATVDVAAREGRVALATGEDALVATAEGEFAGTGFGPADAVAFGDGELVAAGGGRVATWDAAAGDWTERGAVDDVRSVDGDLAAAAGGVFRLDGTHVGLVDARDVATAGAPHAATAEGLYRLGNGWLDELAGDVRVVAAADDERAHAATPETLYQRERNQGGGDGAWLPVELPTAETVAGVAYGETTYAVTREGTFLVAGESGWTSRSLGLPDVRGLAVA